MPPIELSTPCFFHHSTPCRRIPGTAASVSTLFTMVGRPNSPFTAGNGGLIRGQPRLPSIASSSPVSSPQM